MRSNVVLPAPLAPSRATASPGLTCREIPRSAGELGAANGCRNARQPLRAGGKDFSRESIVIAESDTLEFIACLRKENNEGEQSIPVSAHGRVEQSPVR